MSIPFLFGWFRARRPERTVELAFLHSRDRFRDILEVERMRSDRTGSSFALVVFTLPEEPADVAPEESCRVRFARFLERRRRATDHIGEMHDRHVGVVLWDTGEEGAWVYANDVLKTWGDDEPLEVEVFVYPTYVPPSKRGESSSEKTPVGHESWRDEEVDELLGEPRAGVVEPPATSQPSASTATTAQREAKPLEMFFVQPLPFWKRVIDIAGASVGLVLLSPLLLVVAALIKLTSKGPVFFAQQRTGHGGRPFTIYKFRTMCMDAEAKKSALRTISEQDGPAFKMTNDPRITWIGRFLRKTCIDELPQLWNVLIGDMTLVGPRPLDVKEADLTTGWERRRLDVTPGLTCIWQVDGKSRVPFDEWMRMDIRYTRVRSFWQDMKLVFRTLFAMVRLKAST